MGGYKYYLLQFLYNEERKIAMVITKKTFARADEDEAL